MFNGTERTAGGARILVVDDEASIVDAAAGIATFKTIYPGFYQGRAVHIHVKVHVGGTVVHAGQLFFPASVTNVVYKRAPYSAHGTTPDTPNPSDSIFRNGGSKGIPTLKKSGTGYVGTIGMGVHLS